MSLFDANSRDQLRLAYTDAWRKFTGRMPMSAQEAAIADVIAQHPEYHGLVQDPAKTLALDSGPQAGQQNPFLHMGLHLAIRDQIAVDRPPGIFAVHQQLRAKLGDIHSADHELMDVLNQVLWQAQRDGRTPDEQQYLSLARRRCQVVYRS
jgi:Domain of unknown function (DUF1841)